MTLQPLGVLRARNRPNRSSDQAEADRTAWWERERRAISPAYRETFDRILKRASEYTDEGQGSGAIPLQAEDPTLALFSQWAAEDATEDPKEIAVRRKVNAETSDQLRQNRFSLEGRTDFLRLAEDNNEDSA